MEKWDIVVVIIALVGLIAAITGPIVKQIRAMTRLTVTLEHVSDKLQTLNDSNAEAHKRIWEKNDEQDKTLNDHETRIHVLEDKTHYRRKELDHAE